MITFRSFSASIRIDGKHLPHFQPESDAATQTATCWIPSSAGSIFSVWLKQEGKDKVDALASMYLDGATHQVSTVLLRHSASSAERDSVRAGPGQVKPLQFANLQTKGVVQPFCARSSMY